MKNLLIVVALVCCFTSCRKDENPPESGTDYSIGTFVLNEGSFGSNNASITHINKNGVLTPDPYFTANGVVIGDVLQSMMISDGKGYAVLNGSQKIEVFNLSTFKNITTVNGLDYPRYILKVSGTKAYVTNGSTSGKVMILDLSDNTITGEITVGNGPENLVLAGNYVFVCNSGGWLTDHTVSVIDINTNAVVETIDVGDRPVHAVVDSQSVLWVLCSGETLYDENWNITGHTDAELFKIDTGSFVILDSYVIGDNGDHPRLLAISADQNTVYYENNGVYHFDAVNALPPGELLIGGQHNGLGVNAGSGDIWTAGISDFISNSVITKYNSAGVETNEFTSGIAPNGFVITE